MKKSNKRGGVLQIVLVLFLSITFFLTIYVNQLSDKYNLYKDVIIMNKQKNYEILLIQYFKSTIDNDILLSDEIEVDEYTFRYEVNTDYSSYLISVISNHPFFYYTFNCEIDYDSLEVINFSYTTNI